MAIYTLQNIYTVNYPTVLGDEFEAGMALVLNSNGVAVKADRSSISYNSMSEQLAKFIGFASGNHQFTNSGIFCDPVGSNYLDSNNNFSENANGLYAAPKRSIAEFRDENISNTYNFLNSAKSNIRGVGVYSLQGEIFATDQFASVESSFLDADGTSTISFNPGDLLTFGAGVNAGKLVKVDVSEFAPTVLAIGVVEKYDPGSNILNFRHVVKSVNNPTLISTNLLLSLDASNPVS